jgi:pilus assembly protein Flp/PilA
MYILLGKGGNIMLTSMRKFFTEKGQGIVEYALLLAFVVAIAVYALNQSGLGDAVKSNFSVTASQVRTFSTTPS